MKKNYGSGVFVLVVDAKVLHNHSSSIVLLG